MYFQKPHYSTEPSPPRDLSKDKLAVWDGWCAKGDREVAREAATKGVHIDLVKVFLAKRRKISANDASVWLNDEVLIWVDELLNRQQIFRASHILNNIGLVPAQELSIKFYKTTNKVLREYIGNHLKGQNALEERYLHLWHLMELIVRITVPISKYKLGEESIEWLDKQSMQWKAEIASKFFLQKQDNSLVPFLTSDALWNRLLIYNEAKVLIAWIHINYNTNLHEFPNMSDTLLQVFKQFPITNDMLNALYNNDVAQKTRDAILNEFSRFGVFSDREKEFIKIVQRLNNTDSLANIYEVLSKTSSNVSIESYTNYLIDYCSKSKRYDILNTCLMNLQIPENSPQSLQLDLIKNFRSLVKNMNSDSLRDNLFIVAQFLCDNVSYFEENPYILLAILCFTKDTDFLTIINQDSFQIFNTDLTCVIPKVIDALPLLKSFINKQNEPKTNQITCYDMLERHTKLDVKSLFAHQIGDGAFPHFSDTSLATYNKRINYLFYIKQGRPSMACKLYYIDQLRDRETLSETECKLAAKKVYKLALKHFLSNEITASCVAFLEMIEVPSALLRVCVHSALILSESGLEVEYIQGLFLNMQDNCYTIQKYLENALLCNLKSNAPLKGTELIDMFKTYNLVVTFSKLNNIQLPELLLKYCASNNLWLPFLIFAQVHNYPLDQIKSTLQLLKSTNLLEHINHSVLHDIQVVEENVLLRDRDSRKYLLSKIGVRKSLDSLSVHDSIYSSMTSQSSHTSEGSSVGSDFLEIDLLNTKATLAQTLIRCHNSTDPPRALLQACQLYRNPLLAILATSYEPDSIITNWLTWLAVSSELYQAFTNFEGVSICARSVNNLMDNCMRNRFPKALLQSFQIFIPENPLKHFIQFIILCLNKTPDLSTLKHSLDLFKTLLRKSRRQSVIAVTDHEMTYLNNQIWLETSALTILASAIEFNCDSFYEKIMFMEMLCKINIETYFTISCPNFLNLLTILRIIHDCEVPINFNVTEAFNMKSEKNAVVECINQMLDNELFDSALRVGDIEELSVDLILVKQWLHKFDTQNHENVVFWESCNIDMKNHTVAPECVVDFYVDCLERIQNLVERYNLLKIAFEWAEEHQLPNRFDLEKRMWHAYVHIEEKYKDPEELTSPASNMLYKDMLQIIKDIKPYDHIENDSTAAFDKLLSNALNQGNFVLALKLEKMFACKNSDLEVLKLCHSLAEGILMPYQLNTEQRLLLNRGSNFRRLSNRRTHLSARFSSFSSMSHSPVSSSMQTNENVDVPLQDTLMVLYSLAEKLTTGAELAYKIFMMYRISINIEIPYHVVVSNSYHMKLLKDALEDDCSNKLEVVHDFIKVYKWSKDETADFVCEEFINAANLYIKSKTENFLMWELNVDTEFNAIIQLLQDNCSILGYKLYAYASALFKVQETAQMDFRMSDLTLITLLLIASHDCFTADCNMEGISTILKKCQSVIAHLLSLRSWKLIVKLLTGVGRYTEMSYVFQILRENDQFEFLLQKGSRKGNGLKIALLEYLKKYCPDNRELYKLVAIHFALFSEVAHIWEREAQSIIRNVIEIAKMEMQNNKLNAEMNSFVLFSNLESTKMLLVKAMDNYTHATEFHLQGEKLTKAMNAAKQAELIALQMSLLKNVPANGTVICLLNLTSPQILSVITCHLNFDQSYILTQSYNYPPDWAVVLFEQCILKTNFAYLDSFLQHFSLNDSLVHDISRKVLSNNINRVEQLRNMENILRKLPSVHTKYRIASELGFTDLIEELITSGQLAYLKDTVWKRGYKS